METSSHPTLYTQIIYNEANVCVIVPPSFKTAITTNVKRRLAPQPVKIRADIDVTCYAYLGVDAVKEALLDGAACSTSETTISVKLIAPPR